MRENYKNNIDAYKDLGFEEYMHLILSHWLIPLTIVTWRVDFPLYWFFFEVGSYNNIYNKKFLIIAMRSGNAYKTKL